MINSNQYYQPLQKIIALIFFIGLSHFAISQEDSTQIIRKNIVKINLVPVIPALSGQSQQWIGIEYQRIQNSKISYSLLLNTGIFEDYTFIKYYDYFNEHQGFSYSQNDVITRGYHLIPSIKYALISVANQSDAGIFAGASFDFNQYYKKSKLFWSQNQATEHMRLKTTRLGIGVTLSTQYVAFSRLFLGVDFSLFIEAFEYTSDINQLSTPPINAAWKSNNETLWSTIQFMIGYAFGNNNRQ